MSKLTNLTQKGQVTIPKDVRDALGLKVGELVEIDWNGGDEAVIRKPRRDDSAERAAMRAQILSVSERFAHLRTGQGTDAIMRDIRGDEPFPA